MPVGAKGVEAGGLVGDGVLSSSKGGVGETVTVATFAATAVLVGELISTVAGVLVGRLLATGVSVKVASGVGVGVLGELVAVGKEG